jgi:glycosyltransferase involved in cell wall biosynthesis
MSHGHQVAGGVHRSGDGKYASQQHAPDITEAVPPLVSVVIPCYNSARFLAETIESALAQTYPMIEVIAVDDGSSDGTSGIAQSYPVKYIRQQNRGVSAARNHGIRESEGKYVLFLDHDDRLLPEAVAIGVRLLEEHPECAIAVGEHRYIGANGHDLGHSRKRAAGRDHYLMLLEHNFIETPCSALHRRSSFSVAGFFDESVQGAEDHELYLRTARHSAFIAHDAAVAEYRLHDTNVSRDAGRMLAVSHRVMLMELPHVTSDRVKLQSHRRGVRFVERRFGRHLTRQLMCDRQLLKLENRQKLRLLRSHYALGFAAAVLSRLLPASILGVILNSRSQPM